MRLRLEFGGGGREKRSEKKRKEGRGGKNPKTKKSKKKKKGRGGKLKKTIPYRLQLRVRGHAPRAVRLSQLEHPVVERVEPGQRDKLEAVPEGAELLLERRNLRLVHRAAPVEAGRAVVGQELPGELGVDGGGELAGLVEVRGRGLDPEEVGVGGIGEAPSSFFFWGGGGGEKSREVEVEIFPSVFGRREKNPKL